MIYAINDTLRQLIDAQRELSVCWLKMGLGWGYVCCESENWLMSVTGQSNELNKTSKRVEKVSRAEQSKEATRKWGNEEMRNHRVRLPWQTIWIERTYVYELKQMLELLHELRSECPNAESSSQFRGYPSTGTGHSRRQSKEGTRHKQE